MNYTFSVSWNTCRAPPMNVAIAANFTSPVAANNTQHGLINPVHSSTASIVYTSNTLPTPWPILLAGLLLSLLSAIRGLLPQRSSSSKVIHLSFSLWRALPLFICCHRPTSFDTPIRLHPTLLPHLTCVRGHRHHPRLRDTVDDGRHPL
jgi:hypothetical protein